MMGQHRRSRKENLKTNLELNLVTLYMIVKMYLVYLHSNIKFIKCFISQLVSLNYGFTLIMVIKFVVILNLICEKS